MGRGRADSLWKFGNPVRIGTEAGERDAYFLGGFTERGTPVVVTNCTLLPVIGGENYLSLS